MRILGTGSRHLKATEPAHIATAERLLQRVTADQPGPHTLIEGGCRGADAIFRNLACRWGWRVETHRATWSAPCRVGCPPGCRRTRPDGSGYCTQAGYYRNQRMVDTGADAGVALPLEGVANNGTRDCYVRARRAGIPMAWDHAPRVDKAAAGTRR